MPTQYELLQKARDDRKFFSNGRISYNPNVDGVWGTNNCLVRNCGIISSWGQIIAIETQYNVFLPRLSAINNVSHTTKIHIDNVSRLNFDRKQTYYLPVLNIGYYESGRTESIENKYFQFPSESYIEQEFQTGRKTLTGAKRKVQEQFTLGLGWNDYLNNIDDNKIDDYEKTDDGYVFTLKTVLRQDVINVLTRHVKAI